ncbi:MAG: hypothetical protein R3F37_15725 [Candidatus Competibacteraceae bacterium]
MVTKTKNLDALKPQDTVLTPVYARNAMEQPIPKYELATQELDPTTAYNIIHDELMLDGNARLNLATFVTTWMEPEARKADGRDVRQSMIDKDDAHIPP